MRLIHRLLMQVERILQINELQTVTKEVVETARENLVIGLAKEDEQMRSNQMLPQGYRRS